jgi:hypothetical protein
MMNHQCAVALLFQQRQGRAEHGRAWQAPDVGQPLARDPRGVGRCTICRSRPKGKITEEVPSQWTSCRLLDAPNNTVPGFQHFLTDILGVMRVLQAEAVRRFTLLPGWLGAKNALSS